MDLNKIGKFIVEQRKKQNLTQLELAEKLGITDRAVSKWENGKALPDASIMIDLCKILKITVNDLLNGEIVGNENYNETMEKNLLEMVKEKNKADKRLLHFENVIGYLSSIFFMAMIFLASFIELPTWLRIVMISFGFVTFIIGCLCALKIEQVAGYYKCDKCGHIYVPTYKSVGLAPHVNRTRYLKCPHCGKKSWHKKVISK